MAWSDRNWALEMKWMDIPTNISNAYKNLVVPQKTIWIKDNFLSDMD